MQCSPSPRRSRSSLECEMENEQLAPRDELDQKVNRVFAGKVVRKDLVRKVKVGANVPVFVLEYLLGKYCASSDEATIQMGLQVVNDTLANNYIRPDEAQKAQSRVKEQGSHTFIDKVKVRLTDSQYWAEVSNFGHKNVHIPDHYVREYDRLLTGGIWAQVDMRWEYDEEQRGKNPFWIEKLTPIQLATFDLEEYRRLRAEFTTDEWLDLMLRSIGYEPTIMERRLKLLFLTRLIPLCERNFNLVELGPRGTGKSYAVQELSPYSALLTGPTTVANLFGQQQGRYKGMLQIWDAVAFDEVADLQKMPKEVITMLKTYCESGQFQRGQEAMAGYASVAMFGNTQQPVDVMVQTGHLFAPMPDAIRDDMAFLDRLHFYLPGWEIPKMRNEHFTDHYGFVVDYLAEALRDLRKHNFTEISDHYFSLGSHLNARDRKAVRRTVSGMVKILHPNGEVSQDDLAEILELAIEGRRRVKEQLKKMGAFEYSQVSFSCLLSETGQECFVGVPEQGGRELISADTLSPGTLSPDSVCGVGREVDTQDFHVEVIDLLGNKVAAEIGVAFFIAAYSMLRKAPPLPALLVLGDMSIQGNIKPIRSLVEPLQVAMDNGGKRALVPIENKRQFLDVSPDVLEQVDPVFDGDLRQAAFKALGLS